MRGGSGLEETSSDGPFQRVVAHAAAAVEGALIGHTERGEPVVSVAVMERRWKLPIPPSIQEVTCKAQV